MAESKPKKAEGLIYKGHPLRRVDNLIYYGTMADKYIIMMQVSRTSSPHYKRLTKGLFTYVLFGRQSRQGPVFLRPYRHAAGRHRICI